MIKKRHYYQCLNYMAVRRGYIPVAGWIETRQVWDTPWAVTKQEVIYGTNPSGFYVTLTP